jgi:hypothetical protein
LLIEQAISAHKLIEKQKKKRQIPCLGIIERHNRLKKSYLAMMAMPPDITTMAN